MDCNKQYKKNSMKYEKKPSKNLQKFETSTTWMSQPTKINTHNQRQISRNPFNIDLVTEQINFQADNKWS